MKKEGLWSYENGLILLLGMSFGVAFFDRNAANILVPFIEKDLALTNTQVGFLASGLSVTWALGAFLIGFWSDAVGVRKPFLLTFMLIFSVCSVISGLSHSYPMLLASRMVMGFVEGPFLPVCLAILYAESSPHRRGLNAGIIQNFFAALLGQSLAPPLLSALATHYDWRSAFYLTALPGLLCAVIAYVWLREPDKNTQSADEAHAIGGKGERMSPLAMLGVRNILLCCLISTFMVAWFVMGWSYYSRYLVDNRHFSPQTMGTLMTGLGFASALAGFGAPFISDRIGRKPVMIGFCLLGLATPLGVLYAQNPIVLGLLMFLGWTASGSFPLFMGVIPGETISRRYAATAMGLVVGFGEVIGGTLINTFAGYLSDRSTLDTVLYVQIGCVIIGTLFCVLLQETAPIKVRANQALAAGARS